MLTPKLFFTGKQIISLNWVFGVSHEMFISSRLTWNWHLESVNLWRLLNRNLFMSTMNCPMCFFLISSCLLRLYIHAISKRNLRWRLDHLIFLIIKVACNLVLRDFSAGWESLSSSFARPSTAPKLFPFLVSISFHVHISNWKDLGSSDCSMQKCF